MKLPRTDDNNYIVETITDDGAPIPDNVAATLRHLFIAGEIGSLLVIQCTSMATKQPVYILCTKLISAKGVQKLMPICELGDDELLESVRPPTGLPRSDFVTSKQLNNYTPQVVIKPDGELELAEPVGAGPHTAASHAFIGDDGMDIDAVNEVNEEYSLGRKH